MANKIQKIEIEINIELIEQIKRLRALLQEAAPKCENGCKDIAVWIDEEAYVEEVRYACDKHKWHESLRPFDLGLRIAKELTDE